ncbi:MAG: 16S rRNA (cytosine(1402)-N(4))-methyltransferase RsmH [Chloroflexi bacterium]|nr:16S rRNA (cytosine(1402)-N(4))-methyltransferase RsmH [Chloroflexota bacterium]
MHIPVLLDPILDHLLALDRPVTRLIDGTVGAGGHSAALLEAGVEQVLGLDRDPTALKLAAERLAPFGVRAQIVQASYAQMTVEAARIGWDAVDAILLDLGVSSMQLDTPARGFAFRHEGPLDMRFDAGSPGTTAADLVNTLDEDELADLFYRYGEDPAGRKLARAVVRARPYQTTRELAAVIEAAVPPPRPRARRKSPHQSTIHPATRVFQALRIAVNDELNVLERTLPAAIDLLKPGGRLAVISFHSLEDRIAKTAFKLASTDCICPPKVPVCVCGHRASVRLITRKPLTATDEEITRNARSRSAKLRIVEKLADGELV